MSINQKAKNILLKFSNNDVPYVLALLVTISNLSENGRHRIVHLESGMSFAYENPIHPNAQKDILNKLQELGLIEIKETLTDKSKGLFEAASILIKDFPYLNKCVHVFSYPQNYNYSEIENNAVEEQYDNEESIEVLTKCNFVLDFNTATLKYKNNEQIEISPESKPIKLLKLLMSVDGYVTYREMAKLLDSSTFNNDNPLDNRYPEIHHIRKVLVKILRSSGITKNDLNLILKTKRSYGYALIQKNH